MNYLVRLIYYDCMLWIPMIHKIVPECQQTVFSPQILKNLKISCVSLNIICPQASQDFD